MSAPTLIEQPNGDYRCSAHGDTVTLSVGPWTGRPMAECGECGAYVETGGQARDESEPCVKGTPGCSVRTGADHEHCETW